MRSLLLPGSMPKTSELMTQIAGELGLSSEQTILNSYRFWQGGAPSIETELQDFDYPYLDVVIAKSLGTLVFAQAVNQKKISFRKAVLLGVPLPVLGQMHLPETLFEQIDLKNILFVSQVHDKLCPAADILALNPPHMLTIAGHDHRYDETHLYMNSLRQFLFG